MSANAKVSAAAPKGRIPDDFGVPQINAFGREHFEGKLECVYTQEKGRIVHATREFDIGEIIFQESPLHIVQERHCSAAPIEQDSDKKIKDHEAWLHLKKLCQKEEDTFDYEPLWYWCALCSLTEEYLRPAQGQKTLPHGNWLPCKIEQHQLLLLLHHEEVTEASAAALTLVRELCPNCDPIILERLIQIWVLNCFEYTDSPMGYSTYFFSSFMSHSCYPNAVWHYDGSDHVLRARRKISVGDEVCISYLPEDGLLQGAHARRWELHETKRFWCACERCRPKELDRSRGFCCPKVNCGGKVFARVPKAGAQKASDPELEQLKGAVCELCERKLTDDEARELFEEEKKLNKMRKDNEDSKFDSFSAERLQALEDTIKKTFAQHWLADLCWDYMTDKFSKDRAADQRRLMQQRRVFHKEAYDGLSGSHAWTLEAFGDAVAKDGVQVGSGRRSSDGSAAATVKVPADLEEAAQLYDEAIKTLTLMFGQEHEYVTQVAKKLRKIEANR